MIKGKKKGKGENYLCENKTSEREKEDQGCKEKGIER